uniref:Uncharacterized protein n=1 Tax=Chlamydomonas euryale TaxID=1486919 RepID=A0A7R9VMC8_9CHLO|mmetsp:Transcript_38279/g.113441  ORF Transcript_38279/g.113441 Transcript_38279/m.113441 type:complete len:281 (+) Transcript_38279:296-1138(+)
MLQHEVAAPCELMHAGTRTCAASRCPFKQPHGPARTPNLTPETQTDLPCLLTARLLFGFHPQSANNVSFFLEEKAFNEDGSLRQPKELSINKLGHAMHDVDPAFRAFSRSPKVAAVMRSLGYAAPTPVQSMYIFKQPHIGGEVVPHQDSSFIYTEPLSCVGLWWALEDADRSNGCLWALPRAHKSGLRRRFMVKDGKVQFDRPAPEYDLGDFVPLECGAGTLVLLQGENVHYSAVNTSPVSRHSYSMHLVEGTPGHVWPAENWAHRPPENPWTPLYQQSA